jgi:hypothetical protein
MARPASASSTRLALAALAVDAGAILILVIAGYFLARSDSDAGIARSFLLAAFGPLLTTIVALVIATRSRRTATQPRAKVVAGVSVVVTIVLLALCLAQAALILYTLTHFD